MLDLGYCTLVKSYFSNLKYGNFVASILLYKLGVLENGAEWNLSVLVFESSKKFFMNQFTAHVCMFFSSNICSETSGTMQLIRKKPLCIRLHWGQVRLKLWEKLGGKRRALLLLEH